MVEGGDGVGPKCCPACGNRCADGSGFCNRCGLRLSGSEMDLGRETALLGDDICLAYRGWPFATLETNTMTREQWMTCVAVVTVLPGTFCVMMVLDGRFLMVVVIVAVSVLLGTVGLAHRAVRG